MHRYTVLFVILVAAGLVSPACGSKTPRIPGTSVEDDATNREIIQAVEEYRLAVERQDAPALLLMASSAYWEDSGTPSGKDDYGYKHLREVLVGRFQEGSEVRYSMRYMHIHRRCPKDKKSQGMEGCRAYVDVLIDASFTVTDARGQEVRRDKRDQNQLVLEWDGDRWKFLSGM